MTADLVASSAKYLQILIFKCEADWASAMQMKQHASAISGGKAAANSGSMTKRTNANRLRVHYLKLFHKASQAAENLYKLATGAVDDISLIELEGYKAQMNATYSMEKHDFEEALNELLKAKLIFEQIASYQDTLEALIYGEKINQISTFIRSCASHMSIGNPDEIALENRGQLTNAIKTAQSKMSQATSAASEDVEMSKDGGDSTKLLSEVKINGRVIPLKSIKLREAFAQLTDIERQISELKETTSSAKRGGDSGEEA
mgnify:CR=1 FL=1